jgi:mRNA interferase MazF
MLPDAGDVAWVELDPVRGTEQAGRRPALILSSRRYHELSSRALVCPISSRTKDWPFDVPLPAGLWVEGVVLVDQTRMIHWPSRLFGTIERVPDEVLATVRGILATLAGIVA